MAKDKVKCFLLPANKIYTNADISKKDSGRNVELLLLLSASESVKQSSTEDHRGKILIVSNYIISINPTFIQFVRCLPLKRQ